LEKIRVGIVNYLNTKPLLVGLRKLQEAGQIELIEDYPAHIATLLAKKGIDLGLVPVAALPTIPDHSIVGSYCIATNGEVGSVCLFSQQPIEKVTRVVLDYQSRTSVQLARLLFKQFWKKEVEFIPAVDEGYIDEIKGATAGIIIGDRALEARPHFPYIYDLGAAWKTFSNLPFVFAVWASVVPLSKEFITLFDEANGVGFTQLKEVVAANQQVTQYDLYQYYTVNIDYRLSPEKEEAIRVFLQKLEQIK
jgi:chorismate dehydratase